MNQAFFAVFVVSLLILSPIALAQDSGDKATRHYNSIKPNLPKTITEPVLKSAGTAVYEMRIDLLTSSVNSVDIYLQPFDPDAENLGNLPGGFVHSYFQIGGTKIYSSNLESVRIKFKVSNEWTEENGILNGSTTLVRLSRGSWTGVDTEVISSDEEYTYFQSELKDISLIESLDPIVESTFAIIGEKEGVSNDVLDEVQEIPSEPEKKVVEAVEVDDEEKDNTLTYAAVGIAAIAVIAALMFMPGSRILKRNLRRQ